MKLLRGTARGDRINPNEPHPRLSSGRVPRWLRLPPDARGVWSRLAPGLVATRVLTELDELALALVCLSVADFLREPTGRKLRAAMAGLAEFGATPSSRTRVASQPFEGDDPLDVFLRRRGGAA
jgi:phage terminase small subunit